MEGDGPRLTGQAAKAALRATARKVVKHVVNKSAAWATGGASEAVRPFVKPAIKITVAIAIALVLMMLALVAFIVIASKEAAAQQCSTNTAPTSSGPLVGVPAHLVPIYQEAASKYGLGEMGPAVLAAINRIETRFGKGVAVSSAGAVGWMQFLPSTWARHGVDADGDGRADPNNPRDAIHSAANYLQATGAPGDWHKAIFAYNHAEWYVRDVWTHAQQYAGMTAEGGFSGDASRAAEAPAAAGPAPVSAAAALSTTVGATVFGGRGDDPGVGYKGDRLAGTSSFAELGGRTASTATLLGGLPYLAPLLLTNPATGQSVVAYKRDFGFGQGTKTLQGHRYAIDLWHETAAQIGLRDSALVQVKRVDGGSMDASLDPCCPTGPSSAEIQPVAAGGPAVGGAKVQLQWPTSTRTVSSPYGQRWGKLHAGIDIAVGSGTPLRPAAAGQVTVSEVRGGYGEYICVRHADGNSTCYGHLQTRYVSAGQMVVPTTVIGESGSTGDSTGPHLHFEFRLGADRNPVDPLPYLKGAPTPTAATSSVGTTATCHAVAQSSGPVAEQIVAKAVSQIGVAERGGKNCTPYGPCLEWCAAFTTWVWKQAGVPVADWMRREGLNPYWVPDLTIWAKRHGRWKPGPGRPAPGDMAIFSDKHVSLVERVLPSGQITTINGNGGEDAVARKGPADPANHGRSLGPAPITGYISPPPPSGTSTMGAQAA